MELHVLGSSSKGNATLIKSKNHYFMIDCGLSKKYILNCLNYHNLDLNDLSFILITHDHIDHIRQIKLFDKHIIYSPILINGNENIVKAYNQFNHLHLSIMPIELSHDSDITLGYIIDDQEERLVYITDTGYLSNKNIELIKNADRYIFESNYDYDMLMDSNRPYILKERIHSNNGHLSNEDSANILMKVIGNKTKEIILAHLSMECNDSKIAINNLKEVLKDNDIDYTNIKISASKQYNYIF